MNIIKAFDSVFKRAQEKHWDYIYVLVDVHGLINDLKQAMKDE